MSGLIHLEGAGADQLTFEKGLGTDGFFVPEVGLFEEQGGAVDDMAAIAAAVGGDHLHGGRFEEVLGRLCLLQPERHECHGIFFFQGIEAEDGGEPGGNGGSEHN